VDWIPDQSIKRKRLGVPIISVEDWKEHMEKLIQSKSDLEHKMYFNEKRMEDWMRKITSWMMNDDMEHARFDERAMFREFVLSIMHDECSNPKEMARMVLIASNLT
jgi:hypothetical protein